MPRKRLLPKARAVNLPAYPKTDNFLRWQLDFAAPDDVLIGSRFTPRQWLESDAGAAYLRGYIAEHPGTRPRIWWRCNAPEERFLVLGEVEHRQTYEPPQIRESEAAYLHRIGELTPEEETLFAAGDLPHAVATWPAFVARNGRGPAREVIG